MKSIVTAVAVGLVITGGIVGSACAQSDERRERDRLRLENYHQVTRFLNAAKKGDIGALQAELDAGLSINEGLNYESALSIASERNDVRLMKYLLDRGALIKPEPLVTEMPLHAAARAGALNALRFLIDQGADVNWRDSRGLNALNNAAIWGQTEVVLYLIDKGADVNLVDNRCRKPECRSAIHQAAYVRSFQAFVALVKAGAEVNQQDETGKTGLHWAVYSFNPEIVELVLRHGGKVDLKDEKGRTAAGLARFLLEPDEYGRTAAAPQLHKIIRLLADRAT